MKTIRKFALLFGGIFLLSQPLVISQTLDEPAGTVVFCTLSRHQHKYKGALVRLRVQVKSFRHGTALYDPSCSKRGILLISEHSVAEVPSVSHFYQLLQERRLSTVPIWATITGRLVDETHSGFMRQDIAFKLEAVTEVSEDDNPTKP